VHEGFEKHADWSSQLHAPVIPRAEATYGKKEFRPISEFGVIL
jgi:hypothetical protein